MTNEHGAIEERLEKLERQNRRMKLAGLGAVVIAGAFVLMGQARLVHPGTITATKFVLVDAQGRQRATLDMYKGSPILGLFDANGKLRAELAAAPNGPWLQLNDASGNMRAGMDAFSDSPELDLYDANEKPQAMLAVTSDGPGLQLNDASGFETHIGVTDLVTPATGETHKTSAASIVLFGKDRKVLWSAPPQY
jgi:hypothetical protein